MKKIIYLLMLFVFCSFVSGANSWDVAQWESYNPFDGANKNSTNTIDAKSGDIGNITAAVNITGQVGDALDFEESSSARVEIPNNPINWGSNELTVCMWIKAESWTDTVSHFIGTIKTGGAGGMELYARTDSNQIRMNKLTRAEIQQAWTERTTWQHLCFMSNGTGMYIYQNASQIGSNTNTQTWVDSESNIAIGGATLASSPLAGQYFDGVIDEVAIWSTGLTTTQITDVFDQGKAGLRLDFVTPTFSTTLDYPTNGTTYLGTYTGDINITLANVNGSAKCDINDTRWTIQNTTPFGNGTINWKNNTPITGTNNSVIINCTDAGGNVDREEFWFEQDTILDILFYDEETDSKLIINGTVELYSTGFSANYTVVDGELNISSLASEDYEIRYDAEGYHPRIYYINILSGTKHEINLFLLNDSTDVSTLITQTVFDQNGDPAKNITLKMQRNYISADNVSVFKTVSMRKTNFQGQAILYVELYDVFYKIIYEDTNGQIIEITDPAPFLTTTPVEQINLLEDVYLSLREYDNVVYNLTYANQSGTIYARFFYSDTQNLVREGCLNVQRVTTTETIDVCYNCTQSISATISCQIDQNLEGEYKAVGLIDTNTANSWYPLDTKFYGLKTLPYAEEGLFFAAINIGTMVLMGVGSITANIFLMLIGLIAMIVAGFISGFNLGMVYWIIMLSLIILFMVSYSRRRG
jgi:hypothetical protein